MNLHAFRLFHHVAELGSVTKAAALLHISQPAVSAQIKNLERETGLQLLSPQGRGILLTEAGATLAEEARRLFALESRIEQTIADYGKGTRGRLYVAATYLPANFLLPRVIARFKQQYPRIELQCTTANSVQAVDLLLNFKADIALIGGSQQSHPLLDVAPLQEDDMWFVVHPDHPLAAKETTFAEIVKEPFVLRERGSYSREQLLAACRYHHLPEPEATLQMDGLTELIRVVVEGYGIAFLSALEAREAFNSGKISRIQVRDLQLANPIALYTRKEALSAQARHFAVMISPRN
jgi:LysR family transcriptional regulator, low CO2-responsive transcriptional regulator